MGFEVVLSDLGGGRLSTMRTQIAIIGAGPAGMFLAHILHQAGIACTVIERRDRAYVEGRVRAGILETGTVALMHQLGAGARVATEGLLHSGTNLSLDGQMFRIDMAALTGQAVTVYGQQEVMRDLFDLAEQRGIDIVWNAADVTLSGLGGGAPLVEWRGPAPAILDCDFVVGADGYHGISRATIPASVRTGWLGILADVPPAEHELVYASHERGFALASMRSPTRSRYYLQCALDEKIDEWSDDRFWDELAIRLGPQTAAKLVRGPSFEKSIAPLRSFVSEPMRWGRLFLAGDAAHIVPPTGAKGLNLAVSDVIMLGQALEQHYTHRDDHGLDGYSARALARVWQAERFSWWFTALTHRFPETDGFSRRLQMAELDYLRGSKTAQTALAENYVGLPLD
jgi:p-hydroxybenzoate 3-monooxygenase